MHKKLIEHSISIVFVILVLTVVFDYLTDREIERREEKVKNIKEFLDQDFFDIDNPLHKTVLEEALTIFYPDQKAKNDSIISALESYRIDRLTKAEYKEGGEKKTLSWSDAGSILWMYAKFIFVYLIVIVFTYYGAQSFGIYRFVKLQQGRGSFFNEAYNIYKHSKVKEKYVHIFILILKGIAKAAGYLVFFAPAYVIAYSFKTKFDTDSIIFMILLAIVSNGLLINYAHKFYTFLASESRKGYVSTAKVKNLNQSYQFNTDDGITLKAIFHPLKQFPNHILQHIYTNSRFQYIQAVKEQASFLITGLIIIEMALNIQGHLSYEMLQHILYKQYDFVATIIIGVYLLVKVTDMFIDYWYHYETKKYENS